MAMMSDFKQFLSDWMDTVTRTVEPGMQRAISPS